MPGSAAPASDTYRESHLYDLWNDPHEQMNLVANPHLEQVRTGLRLRMAAAIEQAEDKSPELLPAGVANPAQ
jgi:hypothetical protein